jgi:hypothetical protein
VSHRQTGTNGASGDHTKGLGAHAFSHWKSLLAGRQFGQRRCEITVPARHHLW